MFEEKIFNLYDRKANILGQEDFFRSAVLVPLVRINEQWLVLFQKRSALIGRQPGEISFPGGALEDTDMGPRHAAVRESCEELGLNPEDISIIAELDVFVSPFNMIISPYLAIIHNPDKIVTDPGEVERIFYVPLDWLLHHEVLKTSATVHLSWARDFPFHLIPRGKDYPFRKAVYPQHFYLWEDEVIWGLTARILTHFLELIR